MWLDPEVTQSHSCFSGVSVQGGSWVWAEGLGSGHLTGSWHLMRDWPLTLRVRPVSGSRQSCNLTTCPVTLTTWWEPDSILFLYYQTWHSPSNRFTVEPLQRANAEFVNVILIWGMIIYVSSLVYIQYSFGQSTMAFYPLITVAVVSFPITNNFSLLVLEIKNLDWTACRTLEHVSPTQVVWP